jgi:hypothetical protein
LDLDEIYGSVGAGDGTVAGDFAGSAAQAFTLGGASANQSQAGAFDAAGVEQANAAARPGV